MEDIETLLMQNISYSGDCKSSCIEALDLFKEEDYSQANSKLESAYNSLLKAKKIHAKLLSESVDSSTMQISLFLVHAEDQMMSAETTITLVRKFLEIIEKKEGISND